MRKTKYIIIFCILLYSSFSFCDNLDDLILKSKSSDAETRIEAVNTLGESKDAKALSRLIEMLDDTDDYVRFYVCQALIRQSNTNAVPKLIEIFKSNNDENAKESIANAIFELGDASTIPFWLEALESNNSIVKEISISALVKNNYKEKEFISKLIDIFQTGNERLKIFASYGLAYMSDPQTTDLFLKALADTSSQVKQLSILGLGRLREKKATPYIITMLDDPDYLVKEAAFHSLCLIGDDRALFGLLQHLNDNEESLREYAVIALGKTNDSRAIAPLLEQINDESIFVQAASINALGEVGNNDTITALDNLIKKYESSSVMLSSSTDTGEGLGVLAPHLPALEKTLLLENVSNDSILLKNIPNNNLLENPIYKDEIIVMLKNSIKKIKSREDKNIENKLFSEEEYKEMVLSAKIQLDKYKEELNEKLITVLEKAEDLTDKKEALESLGKLNEKGNSLSVLENTLKDEKDEDLRYRAAESLGKIGSTESMPLLRNALKDKSEIVRKKTAGAIAMIADKNNDTALLREMLLNPDSEIAQNAVEELVFQERKNFLPVLAECLRSQDPEIRKAALWAYQQTGAPAASVDLCPLLDNPDEQIREDAISLLGRLKDTHCIQKLGELYDKTGSFEKRNIILALESINTPDCFSIFKKAINDKDKVVQEMAAEALGKLQNRGGASGYEEIKKDKNINKTLKIKILKNKSNIGKEDLAELESYLADEDKEVMIEAINTLAAFYNKRITQELHLILKNALKNKYIIIRGKAAVTIALDEPEAVPILSEIINNKQFITAEKAQNYIFNYSNNSPDPIMEKFINDTINKAEIYQEAVTILKILKHEI